MIALGDPDAGVGDANRHQALSVARTRRRSQGNAAPFGEFDGIAHEVVQDLTDAPGVVAKASGAVGGVADFQVQCLFLGLNLEKSADIFRQMLQVERDRLQDQFIRFDLGQVEYVVENGEEGLTGASDDLKVLALLRRRGRCPSTYRQCR